MLQHFQKLAYQLRAQRWRAPFGEIDLWLWHPEQGDLFLEVKTLIHPEILAERVGRLQKRRILRNVLWLAERFPRFRFRIVYVRLDGRFIELGPEDL